MEEQQSTSHQEETSREVTPNDVDENVWQNKKSIIATNEFLLLNEKMSDIKFIISSRDTETNDEINAHTFILATRSAVFYKMFQKSHNKEIKVNNTTKLIFTEFLRFLYIDQINMNCENVIDLMYLAQRYNIFVLEEKCFQMVETLLKASAGNICPILEKSIRFRLAEVLEISQHYLQLKTVEVLHHKTFLTVKRKALEFILTINSANCSEMEFFKGAFKWAEEYCKKEFIEVTTANKLLALGNGFYLIRFPTMSYADLKECDDMEPEMFTDSEIGRIFRRLPLTTKDKEFSDVKRELIIL